MTWLVTVNQSLVNSDHLVEISVIPNGKQADLVGRRTVYFHPDELPQEDEIAGLKVDKLNYTPKKHFYLA